MRAAIVSFFVGILFALGLGVGGMLLPQNIIGFLDFFGDWQPNLMFVMGGAAGVYGIAFPLITKRPHTVLKGVFSLPTRTDIDARLLVGAGLFGVGWGLGGLCPGPGIASLISGHIGVWVFVGAMAGGMYLFKCVDDALKEPIPLLRALRGKN